MVHIDRSKWTGHPFYILSLINQLNLKYLWGPIISTGGGRLTWSSDVFNS